MPFTPLHLGPGAAFKALLGRHFSFMVFGGAQVLMDIEPLVTMLRGVGDLHGRTHTVPGALVIGVIATLTGRPVSAFVLRRSGIPHYPLTWLAAATGAFVGTFSHVLLDALMHADTQPAWPLASGNALYSMSWDQMHALCLGLGIVGAIGVALRWRRHGKA